MDASPFILEVFSLNFCRFIENDISSYAVSQPDPENRNPDNNNNFFQQTSSGESAMESDLKSDLETFESDLETFEKAITKIEEWLEKFSLECQNLDLHNQQKWEAILQKKTIDREGAKQAIHRFYDAFGIPLPEIRFYSSPQSANLDPWFRNKLQNQKKSISNYSSSTLIRRGFHLESFRLSSFIKSRNNYGTDLRRFIYMYFIPFVGTIAELAIDKVLNNLHQKLNESVAMFREQNRRFILESQARCTAIYKRFLSIKMEYIDRLESKLIDQIIVTDDYLRSTGSIAIGHKDKFQQLKAGYDFERIKSKLSWLYEPDGHWQGPMLLEREILDLSWDELCINIGFPLDVKLDAEVWEKWNIASSLLQHCGWIYEFLDGIAICDRPIRISRDAQQKFHAEPGTLAIEFADGNGFYLCHGVSIHEEWGKVPVQQWKSQWLLEEKNAELRRILVQNIGYDRICQELEMVEIDAWAEYTLLEIADYREPFKIKVFEGAREGDFYYQEIWRTEDLSEPVHLLKMTCPSTGYIHVLRVPPDITSAREAIRWVNHGIDPEEFEIQS